VHEDICFSNWCRHNPISGPSCNDGNACTVNDVCTSGACGGTAITAPAEVAHDRFPGRTTLAWDAVANAAPGTVYDVTSGRADELPAGMGPNETCRASGLTGTSLEVTERPPAGKALWYLVRARNSCGAGTWGTSSNGVTRAPTECP